MHRKTLLNALVDELPADTIRFCSKLVAIQTEEQEGLTIVILRMEDGTIIKTKVQMEINSLKNNFKKYT